MQRSNAIAVAGAVTGILIAASVASVAVVNAASSRTSTDEPTIIAASVVEPESVRIIELKPNIDRTALPTIVVPKSIGSSPQAISAEQARQAATAATPGTVLRTARVEHGGYDSFEVQIQRTDGSIVTGFVEASSGVVFHWVVDKAARAPVTTYQDDDEEHDEGRDEEHDEDHDDRDHDDD